MILILMADVQTDVLWELEDLLLDLSLSSSEA